MDYYEKGNFASIWAFLRLGMKLDAMLASAVMGNIKEEYDGKGYGILQWTHWQRKQGLDAQSEAMGLSEGDPNAQLAYFRTEMTSPSLYKTQWSVFKGKKTMNDATDYFLNYIEMPSEKEIADSKEKRIEYANQIYQLMYKL